MDADFDGYHQPPELSVQNFNRSLELFERKFYATTFDKLTSMTPLRYRENGMSFVQSGLFLYLSLIAISSETDMETTNEIYHHLQINSSNTEYIKFIDYIISTLPNSSNDLKFRWSSRLLLKNGRQVSEQFLKGPAAKFHMKIENFNSTMDPSGMATYLNNLVKNDSGGAIHDTFEDEDLSGNVEAVLITTLYLRARWRSAPTLLNQSRVFHDSNNATKRTVRMIRINDVMKYAILDKWNAEAIEIFYLTQGLSLLILVPKEGSLRHLAHQVSQTNLESIIEEIQTVRVAVTLPLYTLRMTLLLPNKLQAMGISRLVTADNTTNTLRISHAVQRLMFWAEAGKYAYKDDGLEWDEPPEKEVVIDRPYIFYVRWKSQTLMSGNFVL